MRSLLTVRVALASVLGAAAAGALGAESISAKVPLPHWLKGAETRTLDGVFGGAKPSKTFFISYPRTIAVIFEFEHVVICRTCSGPSNASIPRGRVIRVSYDRRTHRMSGTMQFCESRGATPARALCLRR